MILGSDGTTQKLKEAPGAFSVGGLSPGKVTLCFGATGYRERRVEEIRVESGQVTELDVSMWQEGELEGRVAVEAGQTIQVDLAP